MIRGISKDYKRKEGTKTVWIQVDESTSDYTEQQYKNFVNADKWFRKLGSSVTQTRNYTKAGYVVVKDINVSPDRQRKTVTEFTF